MISIPDSLLLGHINQLCAQAVAKGIDVFKVLRAACVNPVLHYKLDSGLLRVGDSADLILGGKTWSSLRYCRLMSVVFWWRKTVKA